MFDIDKLYIARYNYDRDGNKIEFDHSKSYAENSREANENLLLDMYQYLMTEEKNVDETKAPLDNTTDLVKNEILPIIDSGLGKDENFSFKHLSPTYQSNRRYEYLGGKSGIAPFALNSVHHPITQSVGLKFKQTPLLKQFSFGDLNTVVDLPVTDQVRDRQGYVTGEFYKEVPTRVLDWLSAMINAHVDVAKDSYVIRLGINQWTYNMANFLFRSGAGKNTFYFLSQPILKEMAVAYQQTLGKYGVDTRKSRSSIQRDAFKKIAQKYRTLALQSIDKNDTEAGKKIIRINEIYNNLGRGSIADTNTMQRGWLIDNLHMQAEENPETAYYANQLKVWDTFQKLQPYAADLSELVQLSQIDTKKFGNNFALQRQFMHRLKDFILHNSSFDSTDIASYIRDTFLDTKIRNSMLFGRELFDGQFINTTQEFDRSFDAFLNWLGAEQRNTKDEAVIKLISNEIESSVKGEFFDEHMFKEGLSTNEMLYGTNSMARRLDRIKKDIILGKYPELITAHGTIKNELINHLSTEYSSLDEIYESPDIITTPALRSNDKRLESILVKYWEELYTNPNPEISKFAKDLVSYAFITSGDNYNKNSIFNLVPNSIRNDIGYSTEMEGAIRKLNSGQFGIDNANVYLNTWYNDNLVPNAERIAATTRTNPETQMKETVVEITKIMSRSDKTIAGKQYPVAMVLPTAKPVGSNRSGEIIFPRYIKYNLEADNNPETTVLYRYVGYTLTSLKKVAPMYFAVHKKGMKLNGKTVREYDSNDRSGLPFNNIPFSPQEDYDGFFAKDENGLHENVVFTNDVQKRNWNNLILGLKFIEDFEVFDHLRMLNWDQVLDHGKTNTDGIISDEATTTNPQEVTDHSGGAAGTDTEFHLAGLKFGMVNFRHYRGEGIRDVASQELKDLGVKPTPVTAEDMEEGIYKQQEAAKMLKRETKNTSVLELLQRNWAQVKYSDAIFAIGKLAKGKDNEVDGGTGWAVQYAIMERKPTFLYNEETDSWMSFNHQLQKFVPYEGIPKLTKNFAGIGTRGVKVPNTKNQYIYREKSRQAIYDLFENTFGKPIAEKTMESTKEHMYTGNITPDENTIFVFGSNPEGRHGSGSAKIALDKFGAKYGQGEGMQGNAYAIPTKDLRVKENRGLRSIPKEEIVNSITKMYQVAEDNPTKQFKVAYRNSPNEVTLNGYTGAEMIEMFKEAGTIPSNVLFSQEWIESGLFEQDAQEITTQAKEIYSKLGDKTASGNVIINPVYQRKGIEFAKSIGGVYAMPVTGIGKHFGNQFEGPNSVEQYINWVLNSTDDRAVWIRDVLRSGTLKNKPIVFDKELSKPSNATALDYLINQYNWGVKSDIETVAAQKESIVNSFKNELNELIKERPDINRQEAEQELNDIIKEYDNKSADSLNEALLRFICGK